MSRQEIVTKIMERRARLAPSECEDYVYPRIKIPAPPPDSFNQTLSDEQIEVITRESIETKIPPPVKPKPTSSIIKKHNPIKRLENMKKGIETVVNELDTKVNEVESGIKELKTVLAQIKYVLESN